MNYSLFISDDKIQIFIPPNNTRLTFTMYKIEEVKIGFQFTATSSTLLLIWN